MKKSWQLDFRPSDRKHPKFANKKIGEKRLPKDQLAVNLVIYLNRPFVMGNLLEETGKFEDDEFFNISHRLIDQKIRESYNSSYIYSKIPKTLYDYIRNLLIHSKALYLNYRIDCKKPSIVEITLILKAESLDLPYYFLKCLESACENAN